MITLAPAAVYKGKENFSQLNRNAGSPNKEPLSSNLTEKKKC